jgi:protein TonB
MTRPSIVSSPKPIYPRIARESGWEGTVIVRTLIDTRGAPSQVKIRKSCGHASLDQAAENAVANWKFQPARDGNIPITKWVDIPIKFDLNS